MKKNTILIIVLLVMFNFSWSQVGINTTNPSATLDVEGTVKLDNKLYLENPGARVLARDVRCLVKSTDGTIKKYNINNSKYGPINVVQYHFKNVNSNGLQDFNTKIPVTDYLVTVQGIYILDPSGSTNIMVHSRVHDDNVEGFRFHAYPRGGNWWIKAFATKSDFRVLNSAGNAFIDGEVDIFLNVIIYRERFMSKDFGFVTHDLGGSTTGTLPLLPGF